MSGSRKAHLRLIAIFTVSAIALAACGSSSKSSGGGGGSTGNATKQGGTAVVAAEQELSNWNQNVSKDNILWGAMLVRLVWPQFYYQTPDFKLVPGAMADGPATVVSQKPFTVRWKIKQDLNWSDGVPVSSDDLEYYYRSCNGKVDPGEPVDPEDKTATGIDCVSTDGYDQITKFTKVDAKTAEATFAQTIAEYASLFSNSMPPAHIAKAKGIDAWAKAFVNSPIVSAGPYQLKEWKKGDSLTLEKNPKFTGTPAVLDTITFRFLAKSSEQAPALQNSEVNIIYPQPQLDLTGQVEALDGVHSETNFGAQWEHLTFNFKNAILADQKVRKAITLGINRQALVDTLMKPFSDKAAVLNNRIFLPALGPYVDNSGDLNTQNLDQAKQLLDEDGWKVGAGGIREKNGKKMTLRIITTGGNELREKTEELFQAQFKEFGIDLKIDNRVEDAAFDVIFGGKTEEGNWDIALFAWVDTVTPAISTAPVYGTGQGNNPGSYANAQVDQLFDEAIGELDETTRNQELNEIDKMLWVDLPDIPLYQKPTYLAYQDQYVNIVDNTTSEGFTWNADQWGIKQ